MPQLSAGSDKYKSFVVEPNSAYALLNLDSTIEPYYAFERPDGVTCNDREILLSSEACMQTVHCDPTRKRVRGLL